AKGHREPSAASAAKRAATPRVFLSVEHRREVLERLGQAQERRIEALGHAWVGCAVTAHLRREAVLYANGVGGQRRSDDTPERYDVRSKAQRDGHTLDRFPQPRDLRLGQRPKR